MPQRGTAIYGNPKHSKAVAPAGGVEMVTFIPWKLIKRGVRREIITPLSSPDQFKAVIMEPKKEEGTQSALLRALGLAHYWQRLLDVGKVRTITELAEKEGISKQRVSLIMGLTLLAPDIVVSIVHDKASKQLTLDYFKRNSVPLDWEAQKTMMTPQA